MSSLIRVSPTGLSTFDTDDAWGCKRKWWFKYVQKLPDPQGPDAALGDQVHKAIETRQFEGFVPMLQPAQEAIDEVHSGGWDLEVKFVNETLLAAAGAALSGRIDAINPTRRIIRDWKTKKQLEYAKPGRMLESDLQMQLYAAAVAEPGEEIEVQHANIASRPPFGFLLTRSTSTDETRQWAVDKALALSKEMVIYKSISEVSDTEPHRSERRCNNCPFKSHCPTSEKTVNLLNMLLNPSSSAVAAVNPPAPAPAAPTVAPAEVHTFKRKLLHQDVPTDPAVTAPEPQPLPQQAPPPPLPPPPAEAPVEQPKRGRGRPPGSKNKPAEAAPTPAAAPAPVNTQGVVLKSITVTRSATVQVVQFEPMSVTVSATADVSGLSIEEATDAVDKQVMSEVVKRLEQLRQAQKDVRGLKP